MNIIIASDSITQSFDACNSRGLSNLGAYYIAGISITDYVAIWECAYNFGYGWSCLWTSTAIALAISGR